MKKVQDDIFLKTMMIIVGIFILLFIIAYALSRHFILSLGLDDTALVGQMLNKFNLVWFEIFMLFVSLLLISAYILKYVQKKVYEDLSSITRYIYEISENKNYECTLKIQHYLEFLQIAVSLKNIAKRLSQKDKKSSKK